MLRPPGSLDIELKSLVPYGHFMDFVAYILK